MKLIKTLLATTLTLAAATTFAASGHEKLNQLKRKSLYQLKNNLKLKVL
jgi:hypothetical protein